jgi:hypothetical protein
MSNLRTAAQQALEALESRGATREMHYHIITALRAALAQPVQPPCQIAEDGVCETLNCCNKDDWK